MKRKLHGDGIEDHSFNGCNFFLRKEENFVHFVITNGTRENRKKN